MKRRTREHQKKIEKLVKEFKKLQITTSEEKADLCTSLFERLAITTSTNISHTTCASDLSPCNPQKS